MEIKTELIKPYTEQQRMNFIIEQNHNFGFEIKETPMALQAWGYTQEELNEQRQERIAQLTLTRGDVFAGLIQSRLIDEEAIRIMVEQMPEETMGQKVTKMLSKNALTNALNFHRNHPMVDSIGQQLGISSENLDMFFETNDYHYLLPVEPTPIEEIEENIEE